VADIDDEDTGWHNGQPVLWAAGAAAVVLLALLVFAVIRMSQGPTTTPPQPGQPLPSYATSRTTSEPPTTTSYPVPSAQTSEASPGAVTSSDVPTQQAPDPDTPSSTSTTIFNPYVTTTQPAAGHV
jgi:cytoskeletal protein RodZ